MDLRRRLAASHNGALAGAVAFLLVGGVLVAGSMLSGGDGPRAPDGTQAAFPAGPPPPLPSAEIAAARAAPDCRIEVNSVTLALDPSVTADLAREGLGYAALSPAQEVAPGASVAPPVARSDGVRCDLAAGSVLMDGGLRFTNLDGGVSFFAPRAELGAGIVRAAFDAAGTGEFTAFRIAHRRAQFADRGAIMSAVIPMALGARAAVALNAALGTESFRPGALLGTMTITGNRAGAIEEAGPTP